MVRGSLDRQDTWETLALCYHGEDDDISALDLLRKLLSLVEDSKCVPALLLALEISSKYTNNSKEGITFAHRAFECLQGGGCGHLIGVAKCIHGVSHSLSSKSALADQDRVQRPSKALESLESAGRLTKVVDPVIVYHLCLENAEQWKLDSALKYALILLKLEGGSNLEGWLLLARISSALKLYDDAENVIEAGLEQTGKWGFRSLFDASI